MKKRNNKTFAKKLAMLFWQMFLWDANFSLTLLNEENMVQGKMSRKSTLPKI